jgi:hypothetical protein
MLSKVNGAVAMCLHKIQAKKSRTSTPASMNRFFRSLGIKFSGLKKTDGVPNSTGWKESFYS